MAARSVPATDDSVSTPTWTTGRMTLNIKIEDADLRLAVDEEKIERVVYNLMSNALKYTPANGSVCFSCGREGDKIFFSVCDNGPGIKEEDRKRIFDRFFQVDRVHPKGSGIGLSLTKAFVELHGGEINVESEVGKGSEFKVILPVVHRRFSSRFSMRDLSTALLKGFEI